jgi:hypothetical protein
MCTALGTMLIVSVKCYQNVDVDIDVDVAGDHSHNARNARHLIHQIPHTSSLTMAMPIPPNLPQICPHIHTPPSYLPYPILSPSAANAREAYPLHDKAHGSLGICCRRTNQLATTSHACLRDGVAERYIRDG